MEQAFLRWRRPGFWRSQRQVPFLVLPSQWYGFLQAMGVFLGAYVLVQIQEKQCHMRSHGGKDLDAQSEDTAPPNHTAEKPH